MMWDRSLDIELISPIRSGGVHKVGRQEYVAGLEKLGEAARDPEGAELRRHVVDRVLLLRVVGCASVRISKSRSVIARP